MSTVFSYIFSSEEERSRIRWKRGDVVEEEVVVQEEDVVEEDVVEEEVMEEKQKGLDGEIMTVHLTIVILLIIITK